MPPRRDLFAMVTSEGSPLPADLFMRVAALDKSLPALRLEAEWSKPKGGSRG
jgi:hypothetical protein